MLTNYICVTCGVQYKATTTKPTNCLICEDERQYVNLNGQQWTTLDILRQTHHNYFKTHEPGLIGIATQPKVAIGQRALLVQTQAGNVLWDCTPLLDETTITMIQALGGISAIAASHPHLCSTMVEWSLAFDNAPIYWHADDKDWVMRPNPAFVFWEGETHPLFDNVTLVRCGGHFPGSAVLHWADGADGQGVLLTADTIMVTTSQNSATFMYSYPNQIPLSSSAINRIIKAVAPYKYDRIYGGWFHTIIPNGAKQAVEKSAQRYLQIINAVD